MQFLSRKDALAGKIGKYFTGKPCIYGHVDERYTQSGTCVACVATAAAATRETDKPKMRDFQAARRVERDERIAVLTAERDAIAAMRDQLVEIRIRAFIADLPIVRDTVAAVGTARYPLLSAAEFAIQGRPSDQAAGTALYRFKVAPDDVELIRGVANALLSAHKVDLSHVYRHVAAQVERLATDAADPTPDGRK